MSDPDPLIARVHAREVLDSRGRPTVEVEVYCTNGTLGRAIVPSGASTGTHEALELRDGDPARQGGRGVRKAVANAREVLGPAVVGLPVTDQERIDGVLRETDGTTNKGRLGANAILGVSLAAAVAGAEARGQPLWRYLGRYLGEERALLPLPMVNLISGGLHAGGNLDFQDFLLLPVGARSYSEALQMTLSVYQALGRVLTQHGYEGVLVGDEGGYGPKLRSNEEAIELILEAFGKAGLAPGKEAALALDVAASHFHQGGRYSLSTEGQTLSALEMVARLERWVEAYPILSIEDGLAEDDWDGWAELTARLGGRVQLIGDDLFATNPARLRRGMTDKAANAVLVKMNQIGTLSETMEVIRLAREGGYRAVVSARSGETEDPALADLAVASGCGQIKIGSVARSERLAKYNQLLRIEEDLPRFAGWPAG
jgi:enolase